MASGELVKNIPIVGLTAYNDERDTCLKVGMKRFCNKSYIQLMFNLVTKPATSADLKNTLVELIKGELI
jgi:CheY-like chemotaxis protein